MSASYELRRYLMHRRIPYGCGAVVNGELVDVERSTSIVTEYGKVDFEEAQDGTMTVFGLSAAQACVAAGALGGRRVHD